MARIATKSQKSAAATALNLSTIERAVVSAARTGFASERGAMAADIAALQAAAKDGKACKTYADLYKAAVVAEILAYEADDVGLIRAQGLMAKGAKRDETEKAAIFAAANRLSRRIRAAGLEAANAAGKKRGTKAGLTITKGKAPKAQAATAAAPVTEKPAAPPVMQPRVTRAPILANESEWVDHLAGLAAYLRAAQSKNAKAATARVRHAIAAYTKAVAELEKAVAAK